MFFIEKKQQYYPWCCLNVLLFYPFFFSYSNFVVLSEETEIIQPFLLGCDTKSLRVVQICLTALQRLISHQAVSEVRLLQQIIRLTDVTVSVYYIYIVSVCKCCNCWTIANFQCGRSFGITPKCDKGTLLIFS